MKKNHFLISIFLVSALYCDAQSAIPDPEFVNDVEYYDKANNKLIRLTRGFLSGTAHCSIRIRSVRMLNLAHLCALSVIRRKSRLCCWWMTRTSSDSSRAKKLACGSTSYRGV